MLTTSEMRGILAIAYMAAFADGSQSDAEREAVKAVAAGIAPEGGVSPTAVLTEVMMRRIDVAQAAALCASPEARTLAYEVAVQMCDADGMRQASENAFLERLQHALMLSTSEAHAAAELPDALAAAPLADAQPATPDLDAMIRNYAILCGALELLPQALGSMAIIPMQMKMVYRIAAAKGVTLDHRNVKDFLATLGVGLASQYFESFGRKLLGGLLKKGLGGTAGKVGKAGASVVTTFAVTYAMGQVAQQYYASGRRMDQATLRQAYEHSLGQARGMQAQVMPMIEKQAASLNATNIMNMIRGQQPGF